MPQRRPADDPRRGPVGDLVGEVRLAAGENPGGEIRAHPGHRVGKPRAKPGQVQARRTVLRRSHQSTSTLTVSTTQAGLSAPSRSMVPRAVARCAPSPDSTDTSSTPARTLGPTGTGDGKRTLFAP